MAIKLETTPDNIELKTNRLENLDDVTEHSDGYPSGLAVKNYVAEHTPSGYEITANKVTVIDDSADNTKYPTSLAVKNTIEAIPASPATRYKLTIPKASFDNFGIGAGGSTEYYFVGLQFNIPIGKIVNDEFVPTTKPIFPIVYSQESSGWVIDWFEFGKTEFGIDIEGTPTHIGTIDTTAELNIETVDNEQVAVLTIASNFKCDTAEEAQEYADTFNSMKEQFINCSFIYELFKEQTIEFIEK